MRFELALVFAATVSAIGVEQNNSINDTTYGLAVGNTKNYIDRMRGSTRPSYRTTSFRNRFSNRKAATASAGLRDRSSNVMVFNGGCRFEPSKTYKDDFNVLANTGLATTMNNENRWLEGIFGMECALAATESSVTCKYFARANGFKFDRATAASTSTLQLNAYFPVDAVNQDINVTNMVLGKDKALDQRTGKTTYTDTGSCKQPTYTITDAVGLAGPSTAVGLMSVLDLNNFRAATAVPATNEFYDENFVSLKADAQAVMGSTATPTGSTASMDTIRNMSVSISPTTAVGTVDTPLGCCKVEAWRPRSYTRYRQKTQRYVDRMCAATSTVFIYDATTAATVGACVHNDVSSSFNVADIV